MTTSFNRVANQKPIRIGVAAAFTYSLLTEMQEAFDT